MRLEPIRMIDCAGEAHLFHFQLRLLGNMIVLDALELQGDLRAGYEFRTIGNPEDDALTLLGRLVEKMRRALSIKDLATDGYQSRISDQTVRGRIAWDASGPGNMPLVVIDGKEISWDDFGRMLMTFEGWQFRLDFRDLADDL